MEDQIAYEGQEPLHGFQTQNLISLMRVIVYAIIETDRHGFGGYTNGRKPPMIARTRKRLSTAIRTFYNPVGFDPTEVLPPHLHRYADHARFFLHVLYCPAGLQGCEGRVRAAQGGIPAAVLPRATRSTSRSGMPSWSPRRSSAMGSTTRRTARPGGAMMTDPEAASATATNSDPDGMVSVTSGSDLTAKAVAQVDHQGQSCQAERDRHLAPPAHLALSPGHHDRPRCRRAGTRRLDDRSQSRGDRRLHRSAHALRRDSSWRLVLARLPFWQGLQQCHRAQEVVEEVSSG